MPRNPLRETEGTLLSAQNIQCTDCLGKLWSRRNWLKGDGKFSQGLLLLRQTVGDNQDALICFHSSRLCLMAKVRRYVRHHNPRISSSFFCLNPKAVLMIALTYTYPESIICSKDSLFFEDFKMKNVQLAEHALLEEAHNFMQAFLKDCPESHVLGHHPAASLYPIIPCQATKS